MVRYGMTPMQASQAATLTGADALGLKEKACLHPLHTEILPIPLQVPAHPVPQVCRLA